MSYEETTSHETTAITKKSTNESSDRSSEGNEENACCSIEQQILNRLAISTNSLTTIQLSKFLQVHTSILNSILYALHRRGKIHHTPGSPPLWMYKRGDNDVGQRELYLLRFLKEKRISMSTHSIAWELQEEKASVNRILYDLEKDGQVERVQISPPIWKIMDDKNSDSASPRPSRKRCVDEITGRNDDDHIHRTSEHKKTYQRAANHPKSSKVYESPIAPDSNYPPKKGATKEKEHHNHHMRDEVSSKLSKTLAETVWDKFHHHHGATEGKIILAAYALRITNDVGEDGKFEVIAMGTGTKCIGGDKLSLQGTVVHDCHAEIVARRSLLRWLYMQLSDANEPKSYAIQCNSSKTPFALRPLELWLYSSQAPCGDSAVYSRNDPNPEEIPCFTSHNHGKFRTKLEADHGGHINPATKATSVQEQSFDGVQLGNRLEHQTCSDKLAKRCVLGVQGALLSQLIPPLYLTGLVIGDIFSHSHVARAICCRSQVAYDNFDPSHSVLDLNIPLSPSSTFQLHHPKIGQYPLNSKRHEQVQKIRTKESMNWASGDKHMEKLDATTGRRLESGQTSRISKCALFHSFQELTTSRNQSSSSESCRTSSSPKSSLSYTYREHKHRSKEYQHAKSIWLEAMNKKFETCWHKKPSEVDDFS